jgi:hypothetical protein
MAIDPAGRQHYADPVDSRDLDDREWHAARTTAPGREPRFPMFADSGR